MTRQSLRARPSDATVRIGTVLAIPALLARFGKDPARVIAEAGLDPKLFDDPDNLVTVAARGRLISLCVARTGCRHFGLLIGQQAGLHSFGLVGLLAKYSPNVGTALRNFVRFFRLHNRGGVLNLDVLGSSAILDFAIIQPRVEATDQVGAGAVAVMLNIMRDLCGREWRPIEVRFAHTKPEDIGPYRKFFRAPLRFDAEQNALEFSVDWLDHPLPGSDPDLSRLLEKQIDALQLRHGDDFPGQVRSVLRSALLTGNATADRVAALFSMHSRTLNRRLDAFDTSFRQLVDESRFEIARQLLRDSSMGVIEIADMLDYADASAFTRAFRRWSGTTPARWRADRDHAA
jgi:AraC-like DNA-binding protein